MSVSNKELANWEIFVWALYLLGAESGLIDIEDVYEKCYEIAPNRFAWRTKKYPDSKKCNKALQEAGIRDPKLLTKTSDGWKRQLTVEGQEWVKKNTRRMGKMLGEDQVVQEPRQRPTAKCWLDWSAAKDTVRGVLTEPYQKRSGDWLNYYTVRQIVMPPSGETE